MHSALENPIFKNKHKARAYLERLLWADGRSCGYCGTVDESTELPSRPGFYQCNACRKQFTVMVGTVFERSHIPLNKWLLASFLLCASKKGISAHQMHRMLAITYKSAWFMMHRLREAMKPSGKPTPMGGEGRVIEADETYMGKRDGKPSKPDSFVSGFGWVKHPKIETQRKIVALVERGGPARSFVVDSVDKATVRNILFTNADRKSTLMTDEASVYPAAGANFADHQTVNHSEYEYARGTASTNTVEGYFSIFKRGMKGVYQHCSEAHLHRYLAEFDFRYSHRAALEIDDAERTQTALKGIQGKRLTYRRTNQAANA
ncbi:MAG: IS1595 family transposase [Proteobacteria bacterium]|nr:IS1595 family transposase [Pseudomonadota bacterium]